MKSSESLNSALVAHPTTLAESSNESLGINIPDFSKLVDVSAIAQTMSDALAANRVDYSKLVDVSTIAQTMSDALAANRVDYSKLVDVSTIAQTMTNALAANRVDYSKLLGVLNAMPSSFLSSQWSTLDASEVEAFADSLRETADEDILAEADALYGQLIGATSPLAGMTNGLELTLPFEPDPYVRATLQLISVLAVWTVLWVAGTCAASIPVLSGALYAMGAPTPATVWKASGKAIDRIYGKGNYSPPKQIPKKKNREKGIW